VASNESVCNQLHVVICNQHHTAVQHRARTLRDAEIFYPRFNRLASTKKKISPAALRIAPSKGGTMMYHSYQRVSVEYICSERLFLKSGLKKFIITRSSDTDLQSTCLCVRGGGERRVSDTSRSTLCFTLMKHV
jgi:hypothetical protein